MVRFLVHFPLLCAVILVAKSSTSGDPLNSGVSKAESIDNKVLEPEAKQRSSDSEIHPVTSKEDKSLRDIEAGRSRLDQQGHSQKQDRIGIIERDRNSLDVLRDYSGSSEDGETQNRPKRYYYYGHPHSPNFFDRYFERGQAGGNEKPSLGERVLGKFREKTNSLLNAASSVAFAHEKYNNDEDEEVPDNEAAGTFWSSYSTGRGYGGGGGGGYGGGYGKGVNKSAVGLLGFLSLLSLIQSGLTTAAPAPAPAPPGRKRRSAGGISEEEDLNPEDKEKNDQSQKIADIVLPLLTSFSYAMQHESSAAQRLKCILHEVCSTNFRLVQEFEEHGKDVGLMLGNVLESMTRRRLNLDPRTTPHHDLLSKMRFAARTGRNGKVCGKSYPKCDKDELKVEEIRVENGDK